MLTGATLPHLAVACMPPTLSVVQEQVFTPRCGVAACHSGDNPPVGLDLSEGNAYANIVNVDATVVDGRIRVIPGDPENSLLYEVTGGPVEGVRQMPVGFVLEDSDRELLFAWIEEGAPEE